MSNRLAHLREEVVCHGKVRIEFEQRLVRLGGSVEAAFEIPHEALAQTDHRCQRIELLGFG